MITGQQHTLLGTMTTSTTNGTVLEPWLDSMINDKSDFVPVTAAVGGRSSQRTRAIAKPS